MTTPSPCIVIPLSPASTRCLRSARDSERGSQGIDVPGGIALAGYTDSPVAEFVEPALMVVSVPSRETGIRAMRTLYDLIGGRKPRPREVVLDVDLVVRDSCGPHEAPAGQSRAASARPVTPPEVSAPDIAP